MKSYITLTALCSTVVLLSPSFSSQKEPSSDPYYYKTLSNHLNFEYGKRNPESKAWGSQFGSPGSIPFCYPIIKSLSKEDQDSLYKIAEETFDQDIESIFKDNPDKSSLVRDLRQCPGFYAEIEKHHKTKESIENSKKETMNAASKKLAGFSSKIDKHTTVVNQKIEAISSRVDEHNKATQEAQSKNASELKGAVKKLKEPIEVLQNKVDMLTTHIENILAIIKADKTFAKKLAEREKIAIKK